MPIDALVVLCAQLTHNLFAIAKFLLALLLAELMVWVTGVCCQSFFKLLLLQFLFDPYET